ncbi:hypothetical protein [Anaplasma marginale]|nr:hypothetical protein [Anaplasma marginale]
MPEKVRNSLEKLHELAKRWYMLRGSVRICLERSFA